MWKLSLCKFIACNLTKFYLKINSQYVTLCDHTVQRYCKKNITGIYQQLHRRDKETKIKAILTWFPAPPWHL